MYRNRVFWAANVEEYLKRRFPHLQIMLRLMLLLGRIAFYLAFLILRSSILDIYIDEVPEPTAVANLLLYI